MTDSNFSWYPGHIKKAEDELRKHWLPLVDQVIELVDARIPLSGFYPRRELWQGKPLLTLYTRRDLCDLEFFPKTLQKKLIDGKRPEAWRRFVLQELERLGEPVLEKLKRQGRSRKLRVGVCGLPNVGKSTFLNGLSGLGRKAKTGHKPGVTRQIQSVESDALTIMDTPGLMPIALPKDEAYLLALCGLIPEKLFDPLDLAAILQSTLKETYSTQLEKLPKRIDLYEPDSENLTDAEKLLHDFQSGKLGKLNLEKP
ncbi:MAG: GTPase [Candidatus Caenarcaniphilales bacterium]|nr:GTPase [Candidatus Caenarcaniphilales bacterium]